MAKEDHSWKIAIIMPYHNNLFDFLLALSKIASVYVITPRSFSKSTQIKPPVPTIKLYNTPQIGPITHAYSPLRLWRMIEPGTTHVIIKHVHLLENITPIIVAKLKKAHLIVMIQQIPTSPLQTIVARCLSWWLFRVDARFFSVTTNGQKSLRPFLPEIIYLPSPVDPRRFQLAKLHDQSQYQLRILAIGKYIERKNFLNLTKAVLSLRKQCPKLIIRLTLLGPISDRNIYNEIKQLVKTNSLATRSVDVHADISPQEIPSFYANHNLFILPANSEPLGYSVLEAMAAGLPVIAHQEVGAASYIKNGVNGYIIPNARPETIQNAILNFINTDQSLNVKKLQEFGQQSRSIVEQHHAPGVIIKKIETILT